MSDVIIVGGGPAGASLALLLGRRGFEVELFEQARFPREKPCGEGLLPVGVEVLRSLGLETAVAGEPLHGVRYHVDDASVRAGFGTDSKPLAHGLGLKRLHFDAALWAAASRTPGVHARQGTRVDALLLEGQRVTGVRVDGRERRARLVVAADGSSSVLRRGLGLERTPLPRRVGIRAHFQRADDQPRLRDIEILLRHGYELYLTPLPGNELLVAALAYQDAVHGDLRHSFRRWLSAEPFLCGLLDGATQTSEIMGRAPLVRATNGRKPLGLTLLGDAAASVDPITAGGMSLALVTADLLAVHVPAMLGGSVLAARRFERTRNQAVRVHRWLGAGLLALARNPRVATQARRMFQAYPGAMRALVELTGT